MDMIMGVVQDGAVLVREAESMAVVKPVVAAGQTVVTGLLARRWEWLRGATQLAWRRCAVTEGAALLATVAHVWRLLMVREKYNGEHTVEMLEGDVITWHVEESAELMSD